MQWNAGDGEGDAALPPEEREKVAVQDDHGEESGERKNEQANAPQAERQGGGGHGYQSGAHALPELEIQVVRGVPRIEDEAGPWDRPARDVGPDNASKRPTLQV